MILDSKSLTKLSDVHVDLQKVIALAAENWTEKKVTWKITEGRRTVERQRMLVRQKKSQTMKSRHITGHAVDFAVFVDGELDWTFKYYVQVSNVIKAAAKKLKIDIEWGGDWKSFKDGPHIQLTWKAYP